MYFSSIEMNNSSITYRRALIAGAEIRRSNKRGIVLRLVNYRANWPTQ